jgi:hypothetical protein
MFPSFVLFPIPECSAFMGDGLARFKSILLLIFLPKLARAICKKSCTPGSATLCIGKLKDRDEALLFS